MINVPFMRDEEGGMSTRTVQCSSSNTGLWQTTIQGGATDSPEENPPHSFLVEHSRQKSQFNYNRLSPMTHKLPLLITTSHTQTPRSPLP